jgi:DnaJ domain
VVAAQRDFVLPCLLGMRNSIPFFWLASRTLHHHPRPLSSRCCYSCCSGIHYWHTIVPSRDVVICTSRALSSGRGYGIAVTAFVVVTSAVVLLLGLVYYKQKGQNAAVPTPRSNQGHGGNGSPLTRLLYTPEQAAAVKEVLDIINGTGGSVFAKHCRVLGIRKAATPAAVKKAYHKRSRQVHDDRNKAPGAGEAMKAVNEARDVCTDYAEHRTVKAKKGLSVVQYAMVSLGAVITGIVAVARYSA